MEAKRKKKPNISRKTIKKPHGGKLTIKRPHVKKKKPISRTDIDPEIRRCIVNEIDSAKGVSKMSKGDKRNLFDAAFRKCVRQTH